MGHILAEDPCQETGPAETVDRLGQRGLLGVGAGFGGPFVRPRHDAVAIGGIGREHAVITHKVQTRRRDKSGELLDQLQRRKNEVGGPVGPRGFEFETERVVVKNTELTCGQWRPYNTAAQALEAGSLVGLDAGRPMKGESTGGKTERPALDAFLRIDKAATDALACTFAGCDNAPDGRGA